MLSGKLVHLIEAHWDQVFPRALEEIRKDPKLPHIGRLPDLELRERAQDILEHLGHWLAAGNDDEVARRYEALGRARFEEGIPLHESVRGFQILRKRLSISSTSRAPPRPPWSCTPKKNSNCACPASSPCWCITSSGATRAPGGEPGKRPHEFPGSLRKGNPGGTLVGMRGIWLLLCGPPLLAQSLHVFG